MNLVDLICGCRGCKHNLDRRCNKDANLEISTISLGPDARCLYYEEGAE
jgi:hypothetical protein